MKFMSHATQVALALGVVATVALACYCASYLWPPKPQRFSAEIQGEPINASRSPDPAGTNHSGPMPIRKRRPKPASLQHRMVEFQLSHTEGSNSSDAAGFGGSPAKIIFSPSQLAAFSAPPLPAGCQDLDFTRLASFPFDVTRKMADGSNDLTAASAETRARIPQAVQDLDNQFVAIRGFLLPLKMNNGLTIEFLLLRNQSMCCFGSVPKVNEWICVEAAGEGVKPVMDQPITILGKLRVGEIRENGYLVGIYRMEGAQVYVAATN